MSESISPVDKSSVGGDTEEENEYGVYTRTAQHTPQPVRVLPRIDAEKFQADVPAMLSEEERAVTDQGIVDINYQ